MKSHNRTFVAACTVMALYLAIGIVAVVVGYSQ